LSAALAATERPLSSTARILVVDDKESNRYVLATWLRRAGYEIVEAATGEEALAKAAASPVDLVVLDVNLPDMSGYLVCERIKASATTATPVLHVSATAVESTDRTEGLRRGAEAYLVEPVEREELLATVESLLRAVSVQRTAVRVAWRLRQLNEATDAINKALTLEQLFASIVEEAGALFGAPAVAAVVIDERAVVAVCSGGREPRVAPAATERVDALRRAANRAGRVEATLLADYVPVSSAASYFAVPLDGPGLYRGALFVGLVEDEAQPAEEIEVLLGQYARSVKTALQNTRAYNIEHDLAVTLQRSLLPGDLPEIDGLEIAVRYEASTQHAEVGGDFYEVFALDDHVAIAIGDVVGHSLEAAAVMAQLRNGIRSYALEGHGPVGILRRLNKLLLKFHPGVTATVCYALYDRRSGRCRVGNAGHLPALVVAPEGPYYLPTGGPLLGVDVDLTREYEFTLEPGNVLLLFTDGLVERRGEAIDAGLERLADVTRNAAGGLDALCDRLLREAGPVTVIDDIALLAVRARRAAP
jgi:serine phosphatase RsbU (regulator of sigma subunit)/CheY-like chemotaxis protein